MRNTRSRLVKWTIPLAPCTRAFSRRTRRPVSLLWCASFVLLLSCVFFCPAVSCEVFRCPHSGHVSLADYGNDFLGSTFELETVWEPAATAAFSNYVTQPAGFGTGSIGYARHYWVAVADNVNGKFMSKFAFAAASKREDCYQAVPKTGFWRGIRIAALHSIYTDGTDSFESLRWSNFAWYAAPASLASAGLSNTYQPAAQRSWSATSIRFAEGFGGHAGGDIGTQFIADFNGWIHPAMRILFRTHPVSEPQ